MRFSASSLPRWRLTGVLLFAALSAVVFTYLWAHSGGPLPGRGGGYRLVLQSDDAQNLVDNSDVTLAGVKVGHVEHVSASGDHGRVTIALDGGVVPLHQGASFALRSKTLIEETYLDVTDGTGPALKSGASLPLSANSSSVHLDQVLNSLSPDSRKALADLITVGNSSTKGRSADLSHLMTGLGQLGGPGHAALEALRAQDADLKTLTRNTALVLAAVDERQGQVAHLTSVAQLNMTATAAERQQLAAAIQRLPGLLRSAQHAAPSLQLLAHDLRPLADGLQTAAPGLNRVLTQLPATTSQLRATFPTLGKVLDQAPATLQRLPAFDQTVQNYVPAARNALAELNPMVAYMAPYGADFASFFANDSSVFGLHDATSRYVRVFAVLNSTSGVGNPVGTTAAGGVGQNPYPGPKTAADPKTQYTGTYPRVHRASP